MDSPIVILIGGSSGTGKTQTATELARRHEASLLLADDVRLALQRETGPTDHPELHFFVARPYYLSQLEALEIRNGLIGVGKVVSHALEIVIAHHLHTKLPVVIEGDGILPSLGAQASFVGREAAGAIRSVFLVESYPQEMLSNSLKRGRGMEARSAQEQTRHSESSVLYGNWLAVEARRLGLPVIDSRPWETLLERTEAATLH